ncbi:MAG TPA: FIST N-terminal domain-containing protein [Acidimicrobiales bacterium]|nr:FIST N-terminal domain-containing protein [Acidimicrobiales bacterium]
MSEHRSGAEERSSRQLSASTAGFAAGLSQHPDAATAVGEVVGQVLETLPDAADRPPDLALLFVTPPHLGAVADIAKAVRATLRPGALLGCAAVSVIGGGKEVERGPAVSLWAGRTGPVTPFHLTVARTPDGQTVTGWPDAVPDDATAMLLIADPFSFPADTVLDRLADDHPGLPVVGGLASAANAPGGNRLVIDDRVVTGGAVAAFLGPAVRVATVVSQGCRPVGAPFVVTKAEANIVYELAGRPALERLQEVAGTLSDDDRRLMSELVQLGRVIDEGKAEFERGDFLVRTVVGADPDVGAIAVGDFVDVGSTTQFQVRDARSADEDLRQLVGGRSADAALLFTCNGRGVRLFGAPDHDAGVVSEHLGGAPLAGMFCAGEIGPVGGRNFLHGFTASVVLLSKG